MARENGRNAETGNVAAAGRGFIYLSFLFRPVGFCFSKILRLCCSSHHKIRLSYCREKAFAATICCTAEYAADLRAAFGTGFYLALRELLEEEIETQRDTLENASDEASLRKAQGALVELRSIINTITPKE